MADNESEHDIVELAERAKRLAEDTGRDEQDILEDLMDDGILNMSHIEKESALLKGMDTAQEAAKKLKSLLGTMIPVMLMVAAAGAEMFGVIDLTDAGLYDDEDWDGPGETAYSIIYGCTSWDADNYDPYATEDDGSCYWSPEIIWGCMDDSADNYDPEANEDDGSCEYPEPPTQGCTDSEAENYDSEAEEDDGSCTYPPEQECDVGIHNHYRGHDDNDAEQDAVVIGFTVMPEDCDDIDIKIDILLFQHGYPPNYTQQYVVSGNSEHQISHTFDGVSAGTWIPKIKASIDGEVVEDVNFWSIDIEEQEQEQPCVPEFAFYNVVLDWENNTTMKVMWDADSSCPGEYEIEVDLVIQQGNSTVQYLTVKHNITGQEVDWRLYMANDLNSSLVYTVELVIWYDSGEGGWTQHDDHTEQTS